MSVWFDRHGLPPSAQEHTESVEASCTQLSTLIDSIITSGIPASKIAVGGFSMGGGIAIQCMLRSKYRLGAVFALSSFLCDKAAIYERSQDGREMPPAYIRHGAADDFILPAWGKATASKLRTLGVEVDFGLLPGVRHELTDESVEDLSEWLHRRLLDVDSVPCEDAVSID